MIILIGESGSGKSTVINELCKAGYQKAINYTTRKKRPSDDEVQDLVFVTKEQFEEMWDHGKLLQRAEFNNEFYGLAMESLAEDVACISILKSVYDIKNKAKELGKDKIKITVFYLFVPPEERIKRLLKRGDSIQQIQDRMILDKEKFQQVTEVADYVVENRDLECTVNEILTHIRN